MDEDEPRTEKDDAQYVAVLRRENPIMAEVIADLTMEIRELRAQKILFLEELILAQDTLRIYRVKDLKTAKAIQEMRTEGRCATGFTKHVWNRGDGWHRRGEVSPIRRVPHAD